ncbi:MAG: prepilin-type N-terminal cleavage/methylation domain-containing protein [Candidatus Manganitrophus sp.]|nr:prepilin-type N-terminal cleavage/methylation domain-containing protein [Candidatus Manganitrophus sp.]MDC4225956.1 prepilin-type N-terminal cleavage/methylation domain-containing protein [Candidatus Manganitrophus sp.]WDT72768.1 MAG: prepilin-type N-terminal cleavage/methylation domain-containing protein [Candidatus Manganitrophus sp.]
MSPFVRNGKKFLRVGGEKGFTLIEVMISSIILAIALMAVATAEVTALGTNRLSNDVSLATASADEILERIRRSQTLPQASRPPLTVYHGFDTNNSATRPSASGMLQNDYDQWKNRLVTGGRGQVSVTSNFPVAGATLVTVTVTWTNVLPRTVRLETTF